MVRLCRRGSCKQLVRLCHSTESASGGSFGSPSNCLCLGGFSCLHRFVVNPAADVLHHPSRLGIPKIETPPTASEALPFSYSSFRFFLEVTPPPPSRDPPQLH